jgi:hypothetical protein
LEGFPALGFVICHILQQAQRYAGERRVCRNLERSSVDPELVFRLSSGMYL